MSNDLLRVESLHKHFKVGHKKILRAVDGVSFSVKKGETLGIVGESGCGKTTLGRTIMNIYEKTSGELYLNDEKLDSKQKGYQKMLSQRMQMVFQDPYASLNPRMTVGDIISEGWAFQRTLTKKELRRHAIELLKTVGLNEEHANRFPHEFSGGQRQRIGISRALSMDPEIIICDEPISALDVSVQAQVMNLLITLQKERGLTYIFIAHDLSMVRYISKNILVMYLGSQMEFGPSNLVYHHPIHPYTKALFSAIPVPDPKIEKSKTLSLLQGEIPSPINLPIGCKFSTRCKFAKEKCFNEIPLTEEIRENHYCACHFARELADY